MERRNNLSLPDPEPAPQFTAAKLWPQFSASLIASAGAFGMGSVIGWSSPAIPSLRDSEDLGPLSDSDESWIGSLPNAGAFTAGFFVGTLMTRLGRKWTIALFQIPLLVGWLLIIFASNLWMILAGRILTGFGGGAVTLVVPVYISEIVEDRVRGTMSTIMALCLVTGILFSFVVGNFLSWKWLSVTATAVPVITCSIVLMPDSPRWLLEQGRIEEARRALAWLRGESDSALELIDDELRLEQKSVEESAHTYSNLHLKELLVPSILKPLGISMALMVLQQLGGINEITFYAADIFESAGSNLNPNVSAIIIGAVQVVACVGTTFLIDRLGRKPLLVISEIGMALSLAALGAYFYLKQKNGADGLTWLPLTSLTVYIVTYMLGLGTLPWVMLGELVPGHVKGLAGAIANSCNWGLAFVVTRAFGDLRTAITTQGCYWLYAGICCVGAVFSALCVPETKAKSLDQINALFT